MNKRLTPRHDIASQRGGLQAHCEASNRSQTHFARLVNQQAWGGRCRSGLAYKACNVSLERVTKSWWLKKEAEAITAFTTTILQVEMECLKPVKSQNFNYTSLP